MKSIFLALSLLTLLIAFASSNEESSKFIVGGEDATIREHPYMAGIFNFGWPLCGGSIINARSVLTVRLNKSPNDWSNFLSLFIKAAHCIITPLAVSVSVGSSRRRGELGTTYRALRVFIHPDYLFVPEPFVMQNDLAVVRTFGEIRFRQLVQPIPLGTEFVSTGSQVLLTGWGLLGDVWDTNSQVERKSLNNFRFQF